MSDERDVISFDNVISYEKIGVEKSYYAFDEFCKYTASLLFITIYIYYLLLNLILQNSRQQK